MHVLESTGRGNGRRLPRGGPSGALVYGPVTSRRLGRSLGVNLTPPGRRVCNFSCVYCEIPRSYCPDPFGDWPTPRGVGDALGRALSRCGRLDSITISGNGEPTLHPHFAAVTDCVLAEARRARARLPVRILTNGTGAVRPEVRRALERLDERIVTLDAAACGIDRPDAGAPLGAALYGVALLRDVTIQSCFVEGAACNAGDEAVGEWVEILGELRPRRVQVYTVNRRPALPGVLPVPRVRLEQIARTLRDRTGLRAAAYA